MKKEYKLYLGKHLKDRKEELQFEIKDDLIFSKENCCP